MKNDAPVMLLATKHALYIFGVLTVLAGILNGMNCWLFGGMPLLLLLAGLGMLFAGSLLHLATALTLAAEETLRRKSAALERDAARG